ncbi:MAG: Cys-tRNA(Pro) deacylase [Proteobacteria bacterium]|nr:MAG: Cys-tRNA(Pro) deacylase [Pseudomonadota bacterium]
MTPAILALRKAGHAFQVHEYPHNPAVNAYGLEAVEALQLEAARVFKTLLLSLEGDSKRMAVGIVPVSHQLDMKAFARALGAKKADMADPKQAERMSGYVLGGISPIAQKKRLPTVLDESALRFNTIFVSAGKRGLEIELDPELLLSLCDANVVALCR